MANFICRKCKRNASIHWWKCCPEHCTQNGPDVYCDSCVQLLHPEYKIKKSE